MKRLISLFLLALACIGTYATISGPSLVLSGSTYTYTYSGSPVPNYVWQCSGGTITTASSNSVTITWGSSSTVGTIALLNGTIQVDGYGSTIVLPPVAIAATNVASTSFKANWNTVFAASSYLLDASTSSSFSTLLSGYPVSITNTYATVSGLTANTVYYYRVRAVSTAGTTTNSNVVPVLTGTLPPPTGVTTSIAVNNSIKVTWVDNSTSETGFEIERSIDSYVYSKIATINTNTVQFVDINLTPGVTYYYRVRGIIGFQSSTYANSNSSAITKFTPYTSATTGKICVISTGYGENGTVTGQAITYFDNLGRSTQAVTRSINDGRVLGAQTYYDNFGRQIISTLAVPVAQTNLNYIASLATKSGTTTDLEALTITETTVKDLAINVASPLGVYYSASGIEGYVPEDAYPYTAVQYSKTRPGVVRKTTLAGQYHRLDQGHEVQSYIMSVTSKELERFTTTDLIDAGIELDGLIKTISVDPDGKETITYSTSDGKLVSNCISNSPNATDVKAILFSIDAGEKNYYFDIHIPKGIPLNTFKVYSSNGSTYKFSVIDLKTDNVVSGYSNATIGGSSTVRNLYPGIYRLVFQCPPSSGTYNVNIGYNINYYNHSLSVYDKADHLVKSYSPKAVAAKTPAMVTTYEYNSLGQLLANTSPDEGRTEYKYRTDGEIRYSQNALQRANETAVNSKGYFSYTNYDATGRIISVGEYKAGSARFASLTGMETLSGTLSQVTTTGYDIAATSLPVANYTQHFTYGKVSKTSNDNCTTWYSYTYDGKIEWVMQQYTGFDTKTIDYEYDFNDNVVRAIYQKNNYAERFDHEYVYDADGRLSLVFTKDYITDFTNSKVNQQKQQAKYIYYAHGPLKRVELADKLQGIDYVYTINGWLKSINNPKMVIAEDPGADGPSSNQFGQDVFAMTLDYFCNDYNRTGKTIKSSAPLWINMFGGLIYAQRWNTNQIDKTGTAPSSTHSMYNYDYTNENWLGKATFGTYNNTSFTAGNLYKVYGLNGTTEINIPYDANGNILNMAQNGSTTTNLNMDKLAYNYLSGKNQLGYVTDAITSDVYADDLTTQLSGNYTYDAIGRMTGNTQDLHYFDYDVYGHVTKIYKNSAKTQILSEYSYDDKGFRIKKIDRRNTPATVTWYVRDAGGNLLTIYSANEGITPIPRIEVEVYGSSRLGTAQVADGAVSKYLYELTDHLGNVRAMVAADGADANTYPDLAAYTDYYPFGMAMPDRVWISGLLSEAYRFGYQGQFAEKDPETKYSQFEARLYDGRIGRWMIPDPAGQYWSPYLGMGNNWVSGVDPDGRYSWAGALWRMVAWGGNTLYQSESTGEWGFSYSYNSSGALTDGKSMKVTSWVYKDFAQSRIQGNLQNYFYMQERMTPGSAAYNAASSGRIDQDNSEYILAELGVVASRLAARVSMQAMEGIYEFTAASGKTYVGQSGNIPLRLEQHIASGKLLPGTSVKTTTVLGGKTAREIAEQTRISALGGIKYLENIRNPIGIARQYLLK
jgi:RHS repeat-associated protein